MNLGFKLKEKIHLLLLIIGFSLILFQTFSLFSFTLDDSYISLRYAKNLAYSGELNWNPREPPVEGYSNFLWTVLAALFLKINLDPLLILKWLGIIFALATAYLVYRLSQLLYEDKIVAALAALIFSAIPLVSYWAISGMETSFFTFFMVLSVYFLLKEGKSHAKFPFSSLLLAITALIRPEGFILMGLSLGYKFFLWKWVARDEKTSEVKKEDLRKLLWWLLPLAFILIPYLVWKISYYGHLFPNSFYYKKSWGGGVDYALNFFYSFFIYILMALHFIWRTGKAVRESSESKQLFYHLIYLGLAIFVVLLPILSIKPVMGEHFRFLLPALPFICILCGGWLNQHRSYWTTRKITALLILMLLAAYPFYSYSSTKKDAREYASNEDRFISDLVLWLAQSFPPETTVAIADVGAIAYLSEMRIIDYEGLNDPVLSHGWNSTYFWSKNPDIIVISSKSSQELQMFTPNMLHIYSDPLFQNYTLVRKNKFSSSFYHWIYVK